jgi:L-serine dehydratase
MGFYPHDERLASAIQAAEGHLNYTFTTEDLGDVHPNTVRLSLRNEAEQVVVTGSSLGGGLVKIFNVNGFEIAFGGSYYTLLVEHDDKPGVIARVARVLADDEINIATMHSARLKRGGKALMSLEIDKRPADYALAYLTSVPYITWLRLLPEVMQGESHDTE